jgi:hypothetical protein
MYLIFRAGMYGSKHERLADRSRDREANRPSPRVRETAGVPARGCEGGRETRRLHRYGMEGSPINRPAAGYHRSTVISDIQSDIDWADGQDSSL